METIRSPARSNMADLLIPQHILDDMSRTRGNWLLMNAVGCWPAGRIASPTCIASRISWPLEGIDKQSTFDQDKAAHLERLSPEERAEIAFVMDMQEFSSAKKDIRKNGLDLQVVYHSHPKDPARPSLTDIKIATDYEEVWPQINLPVPAYLLVSLMNIATPDVRTYWIKAGKVTPADVRIV